MIYFIIVCVIALVLLHYFTGTYIYIITYTVDIDGKREIFSCRYKISVKSELPTTEEFLRYVEKISVVGNNFRIIDVHKLT
jgi:hypothetical protein